MTKGRLFRLITSGAFVCAQLVLFALFVAEDFGGADLGSNEGLKYAIVCLSFAFSTLGFVEGKRSKAKLVDATLLALGLALTAVSDWFLLVTGTHYEIGVTIFILAQLCHAARIERGRVWRIVAMILRVVLPALGIVVALSLGEGDALILLVIVYFVQLVLNFGENLVKCFDKNKRERQVAILLSVGFLLFIGCDICVGLSNLFDGMANSLIWLFYAPSQTLIALSCWRSYEKSSA